MVEQRDQGVAGIEMALVMDPERKEIAAFKRVLNWRGARVLEIGCGDGRLTQRLARLGARVLGIDPDRALIAKARRNLPARYKSRVRYAVGSAERLTQKDASFPIVVLSWVL